MLTRADLVAIRLIIREEVAAATRSGRPSTTGIDALIQEDQCREEKEFMDLIDTATGSESISYETMARRAVTALRRMPRRSDSPKRPAAKRTASR